LKTGENALDRAPANGGPLQGAVQSWGGADGARSI
jgi:hypothetical protein